MSVLQMPFLLPSTEDEDDWPQMDQKGEMVWYMIAWAIYKIRKELDEALSNHTIGILALEETLEHLALGDNVSNREAFMDLRRTVIAIMVYLQDRNVLSLEHKHLINLKKTCI